MVRGVLGLHQTNNNSEIQSTSSQRQCVDWVKDLCCSLFSSNRNSNPSGITRPRPESIVSHGSQSDTSSAYPQYFDPDVSSDDSQSTSSVDFFDIDDSSSEEESLLANSHPTSRKSSTHRIVDRVPPQETLSEKKEFDNTSNISPKTTSQGSVGYLSVGYLSDDDSIEQENTSPIVAEILKNNPQKRFISIFFFQNKITH